MSAAQGPPRGRGGGGGGTATARRLGRWVLAQTAFLFPFAVSLAANIAAGVRSGSLVLLAAGVVIPTSLFIAVEVWFRMPAADDAAQWVRLGLMSLPVVVAGAWSWLDITSLLLSQYHQPWWLVRVLCSAAPLSIDGLGLLAVYTRTTARRPARPVTRLVTLTVRPAVTQPVTWGGPETVTSTVTPAPVRERRRLTPSRVTPAPVRVHRHASRPAVTSRPAAPSRPRPSRPSRVTPTLHAVRDDGDGLTAMSGKALRELARAQRPQVAIRGSRADVIGRLRQRGVTAPGVTRDGTRDATTATATTA